MLFFPIVVIAYFIIPNKIKHLWLLVMSYFFYMCWNAKYALLMLLSTTITFASGILIDRVNGLKCDDCKKWVRKKWIVGLCFGANLAILFFFKYFNFTVELMEAGFELLGITLDIPELDVVLPVGISFYTFQALSYTMDVYREEISAEKNFFRYALFVSFFPQLVAGPIERSKHLLQQLDTPRKFDPERVRDGILLMLWGFFLKIVLADRLAIFVDTVYGDIALYPGWYLIVATILFAIQIYCDFAGYSTIAVGTAEILGVKLMENFNAPYMATSVSGFWRRWHISLTSWFMDYLYIPLGGSRKGIIRKYINKMIVFLVSGLWHGASLTFVLWGAINGLYQVLEEFAQPLRDKAVTFLNLNRESLGHVLMSRVMTFVLIDFSWIFFRARGIKEAVYIVKSVFTASNPWILFDGSLYQCGLDAKNFGLVCIAIAVLMFADWCKTKGIVIRNVIVKQDDWFRCIFIAVCVCFLLLFGLWGPAFDQANFIYFQF